MIPCGQTGPNNQPEVIDVDDDDGSQQAIITVDKRWKTGENDDKFVDSVVVNVAAAEVAPMVCAVDGAMEFLNF